MDSKNDFWKSILKKETALDMPERLAEVLFGLIMVLSFTGTISVSTSGRQEVGELLWAALGCNLAWGIVDAIMYIMDTLIVRSHDFRQLEKISKSTSPQETRKIVRDNISPLLSELMTDEDIDRLGNKLHQLPQAQARHHLTFKDLIVAAEIFLLVFLSTFPVVLPFLFINEVTLALRISNLVALCLLFLAGFSLAKYARLKPFATAIIYTAIGIFLVGLTIALGG